MKKLLYILLLFTLLLSACGKDAEPKKVAVDKDTSVKDIVGAIVKKINTLSKKTKVSSQFRYKIPMYVKV